MRLALWQHLAALALVACDVLTRGVRIRLMLPVSLVDAMAANTCGDALAALTPARLGGEPIRFAGFLRAGAGAASTLAAFATEVVVDAILITGIGAILAVLFADAGREWVERLLALTRSPLGRWITVAVVLGLATSGVMAARWRRRLPSSLAHSLKEAWRIARTRPPRTTIGVAGLTLVSMAARTAVLPVLALGLPGTSLVGLIAGSFALVYIQNILPTPAGAGGVELSFVAGFAGSVSGPALASLLLVWRFYTIILGVVAGALLVWRVGVRPRSHEGAAH